MEQRWLTIKQFCILYGFEYGSVLKKVRQGKLKAVRVGKRWRILDVGRLPTQPASATVQTIAALKEGADPVEEGFFFQSREVAVLLGVTRRAINLLAQQGKIRHIIANDRRFFPLSEVRRLLAQRQIGRPVGRPLGSKSKEREAILEWARKKLGTT